MIDKLRNEPALTGAILSLLGAAIGIYIKNPALVASLVGVAAAFFGIRQVVVPVTTAATQITQAATQAATAVATNLDSTIAGAVGDVTQQGKEVVNNAVTQVVGAITGK